VLTAVCGTPGCDDLGPSALCCVLDVERTGAAPDEYCTLEEEFVCWLSFGGGIGGLLFQKRDGEFYYYNYDGRGNVSSVTDEGENTVAFYEYSAYGKLLTKAGSLSNDFMYSTKQYHEKSGLYYFGFRWYDPAAARP